MYKAVLRNGKTVGYYIDELPDANASEDYISVSIQAEDTAASSELQRRGFFFAERRITIEIPLGKFQANLSPGRRFDLSVSDQWDVEEVFRIAAGTFHKDVRFALDSRQEDTELKNELLYGFILEQKRQGVMATCLRAEGELEGFNLWRVQGCAGRIELGAVSAQYRGTGIALPLYSCTLNAMKDSSSVLRHNVASTNTASLNLHAMLARCAGGGFRFGPCIDHYKKAPPVPY